MLHAIAILGGWLLMMGQHSRSESLFYYFRIEDQVPENPLAVIHIVAKPRCKESGVARIVFRTFSSQPNIAHLNYRKCNKFRALLFYR